MSEFYPAPGPYTASLLSAFADALGLLVADLRVSPPEVPDLEPWSVDAYRVDGTEWRLEVSPGCFWVRRVLNRYIQDAEGATPDDLRRLVRSMDIAHRALRAALSDEPEPPALIPDPHLPDCAPPQPIASVLNRLAGQELCDGDPYDQMVAAAERLRWLERFHA